MRVILVGGALIVLLLVAATLSGCTISTSFRGPGYDRKRGVTLEGVGDTVVVGMTHAKLDRATRKAFDEHSGNVIRTLDTHDGFVGRKLRLRLFGNEVWTMTVWRDESALQRFVQSMVHVAAMAEGLPSIIEGRFGHFEVPVEEIPLSWKRALELLGENVTVYGSDVGG